MEATHGELPASLQLAESDSYRQMTGTGDLWVDEAGLPARFWYNGQQWYLDPNEADTNSDGLADSQ